MTGGGRFRGAAGDEVPLFRGDHHRGTRWWAEVVAEAGAFSVFVPGIPVAAGGETFDEAVTETVDALREYAEDWGTPAV